jgi:Dyp-type peroxidase family
VAHAFATVVVAFKNMRVHDVERTLDSLSLIAPANAAIAQRLDQTGAIHFLSVTVVPDKEASDAHLVLEVSGDGSVPAALDHVVSAIEPQLRQILLAAGLEEPSSLATFLREHHHDLGYGWFGTRGLPFTGNPELTVARITRERDLARHVADLLDNVPSSRSALETLHVIRSELYKESKWKFAFVSQPAPFLDDAPSSWGPGRILALVGSAFTKLAWPLFVLPIAVLGLGWIAWSWPTGALFASIVLIVELACVYKWLRKKEASDKPCDLTPGPDEVAELMKRENFCAQNHLAGVSDMKPGLFRRFLLRVGFWTVAEISTRFGRPGFLSQIGSIHFARWILLPGTNKLVFLSNYDGSWENYLEDFIERAHAGLTAIWSNTQEFPRTTNLFGLTRVSNSTVAFSKKPRLLYDGAYDGDRFKRWARRQQRPTRFWYSAYPSLTMERIRTNAAIRQGIANIATEDAAADWLASFGSAPRPGGTIEAAEIPTLVFGGMSSLRYAACISLKLSKDGGKCRDWLREIESELSFGLLAWRHKLLLVAFSSTGLDKLGMCPEDLATFPAAFHNGMTQPWRARVLGDVGPSDPSKFVWGGSRGDVDALMLIYAENEPFLSGEMTSRIKEAREFGHTVVHETVMDALPEDKNPNEQQVLEFRAPEKVGADANYVFPKGMPREPFGFVDGISQPIIRGTRRTIAPKDLAHAVEPGEFILGYLDNRGFMPPSPSVAAKNDPDDILPAQGSDSTLLRPDFLAPQPNELHDFGANGTYLVVRQIEQHVDEFNAFLVATADKLRDQPPNVSAPLEEWIAAKMVGRWKDGTSLVRYPHAPGSTANRNLNADVGGREADASNPPPAGQDKPSEVEPDNDFLFGVEDPNARRCPFGAHIRRTNPRDSFDPGSTEQLKVTNRHRILRVGRTYTNQNKSPRGLMFMCLNGDIQRQFEFVQQSWVASPSFHGLENENDPMIGGRQGTAAMCIPMAGCPVQLKGLKDFVQVIGGGYFFLPGRQAIRLLATTPCPKAETPESGKVPSAGT